MWAGIADVVPFLTKEGLLRDKDPNIMSPPSATHASGWNPPSLNVSLDRKAYRPGDTVVATIDISSDVSSQREASFDSRVEDGLVLDNLAVEFKGTEKLDPQWLITPKLPPGSKQRKGERTILDSSLTSVVANVHMERGTSKSYLVRTMLPGVLPPSYRGTAVRYFYYLTVSLNWRHAIAENNGHFKGSYSTLATSAVETRIPLVVWTLPNFSGLTRDELTARDTYGIGGIVPVVPVEVEIQWKEKDIGVNWVRTSDDSPNSEFELASKNKDGAVHGTLKGNLAGFFEHSLSLQSPSRGPVKETTFNRAELVSRMALKRPTTLTTSTSETLLERESHNSNSQHSGTIIGLPHFEKKARFWSNESSSTDSEVVQNDGREGGDKDEPEMSSPLSPGGYIRGKMYNIRIDDEVLVRLSPKNPDSTYYFGDTVAGVITFPHEEGSRRCLEVSTFLELREVLNPTYLHPSRKNSPVITKVQAEYFEVVADMLQTHFMFSIPLDGPASFVTPTISVQWFLRFEFVATPRNIDWSKYEHPLQIKDRDRGEWTMPIVVHASLPRTHAAGVRRERPLSSLRDFWIQSPKATGWSSTPLASPSPQRDSLALADGESSIDSSM
ncbi:hypothetical protein O6H91_05G045900 [Diphasiastrum complanatum]|uniref:Uncharacterized protein n=1 Tax=Diphasiastrum complanatum TaxID=34168 RepID=A0ACC2DMW6_DIPCM|nr:hypothetical protein O6H91_05G045900 [Diphasiastrum complanatum]